MTTWHILTGEYPPQHGGVSDYTRLVAQALVAAGDEVVVWAPPCDASDEPALGIDVRRLPDHFGPRSLRFLDRALDQLPSPQRLLVQYVPHAFGWKAANIPFCLWLRSRRRDSVWVVFHEVAFPLGEGAGVKGNALGLITRWMASVVGGAAERIFVSTPAWRPVVQQLVGTSHEITWLPIPASIPLVNDAAGIAAVRDRIGGGHPVVGHMGTYGPLIRPALEVALPALLSSTDCRVLLLGRGGTNLREYLVAAHPEISSRITATGDLSSADVSRHLSACDVMVQPYPDGVTSRRTTVMSSLLHERPVVTTSGRLTEALWAESGAVVLVDAADHAGLAAETAALLSDPGRRARIATAAAALYDHQFQLTRTIHTLRSAPEPCAAVLVGQ